MWRYLADFTPASQDENKPSLKFLLNYKCFFHVSKIELVVSLQLNVFCKRYLFNDYFTVACWSQRTVWCSNNTPYLYVGDKWFWYFFLVLPSLFTHIFNNISIKPTTFPYFFFSVHHVLTIPQFDCYVYQSKVPTP